MSQLADVVKASVDIVDVASRYITLRRSGSNFVGLSPFKKERSPSFVISPQKQIFKCFSSGLGGNVITLVMELEKIDFMDAIKMLAQIGNVNIEPYMNATDYDKNYNSKKHAIKRLNTLVAEYARQKLSGSTAWNYCVDQRKLTTDTIERFDLGYVPDSYDDLIVYLREKGFSNDDMIQASIAKDGQHGIFSFFRDRLLFPIRDQMDNVIGFGARALQPDQQPKYLNTADTALYDKSRVLYGINFVKKNIRDFQKIIVVEGYMDVIALHTAGFPIAVATCGTSLTKHHMMMMQRYTNDVVFLFDNDEAGLNATIRGLKLAYARDVFPRMISLDETSKDIDDFVRHDLEHAHERVQGLIDGAADAFERVFQQVYTGTDASPVQQQKLLAMMFDLLQAMQSVTVQMHYLNFLSEKLGVNDEYIKAQYFAHAKNSKKHSMTRNNASDAESEADYRPKKAVLLAALVYNDFLDAFFTEKTLTDGLQRLLQGVSDHQPDELFSLVLSKKPLSEEDTTSLEEEQLWREHEFATLTSDADKWKFLRNVLLDELNRVVKSTLKLTTIDVGKKSELLALLRVVGV